MAKEILRCTQCKDFTLQNIHCDKKTIPIKPARFSPEDKYGFWRRQAKRK